LLGDAGGVDADDVNVAALGKQEVAGVTEPADRIPPLQARLAVEWQIDDAWRFDAWLAATARQDRLSARDVDDVRIDPLGTPGWAVAGTRVRWAAGTGWWWGPRPWRSPPR